MKTYQMTVRFNSKSETAEEAVHELLTYINLSARSLKKAGGWIEVFDYHEVTPKPSVTICKEDLPNDPQ